MNSIKIRLFVTPKDIDIMITALNDYAEKHRTPACYAEEAKDIARLIKFQADGTDKKQETC